MEAPMKQQVVARSTRLRRILALALSGLLLPVFLYLCLTLPIAYPDGWDQVKEGMSRTEVNAMLTPHDWQKDNSGYLIFYSRGLRTWYIDVGFEKNTCSGIRIFHEDLHDKAINETGRVLVYIRAMLMP